MQVLAICGNLRARSSNLSLLQALAELCPPEVEFLVYGQLAEVPPFNPGLMKLKGSAYPQVAAFRSAVREASAIVISSPEYAIVCLVF